MRGRKKRAIFGFYFFLALLLMLTLNIVDIFMLKQRAVNWEDTEKVDIPNADVQVHPYHFWVNTVFYMTAQFAIAIAYWFTTKDMQGMIVLLAAATVFVAFAVQDVMFFLYQGQDLPNEWTWLYWQNRAFGSPLSARFVLNMAMMGSILIVALFFFRYRKLR